MAGRVHILKCWPAYFQAIKDGDKTFEVRYNGDAGFQAGDEVQLREWNPETRRFTGEVDLVFRIGYVQPISTTSDFVAFSLLEPKRGS